MAEERDERLYLTDIRDAIDRILEYTSSGRKVPWHDAGRLARFIHSHFENNASVGARDWPAGSPSPKTVRQEEVTDHGPDISARLIPLVYPSHPSETL